MCCFCALVATHQRVEVQVCGHTCTLSDSSVSCLTRLKQSTRPMLELALEPLVCVTECWATTCMAWAAEGIYDACVNGTPGVHCTVRHPPGPEQWTFTTGIALATGA